MEKKKGGERDRINTLPPWQEKGKWAARKVRDPPMPEVEVHSQVLISYYKCSKALFFKGDGKWGG